MKNLLHRIILSFFVIFVFSTPNAFAEDKKKEGAMSNPLTVEVQGVVVPVANGRRLVNYAFMTLIIYAADDKSANLIRNNQFLVKDAIVRATSKAPVPVANPSNSFNGPVFGKTMIPVIMGSIAGTRVVRIDVVNAQMMRR